MVPGNIYFLIELTPSISQLLLVEWFGNFNGL